MRKYTNRFQYAFNDDHSEVTINFFDEYPIIPNEPDQNVTTDSEIVASIVMSGKNALELATMLKKSLEG